MADRGVHWRLGEVPCTAPALDAESPTLKMNDATDAMYSYGMQHGAITSSKAPAVALAGRRRGGSWAWWCGEEDYGTESTSMPERAVILTAGGFATTRPCWSANPHSAAWRGRASSYLTAGERGECFPQWAWR